MSVEVTDSLQSPSAIAPLEGEPFAVTVIVVYVVHFVIIVIFVITVIFVIFVIFVTVIG